MKVIILSPNTDTLFTPELKEKLSQAGEIIYEKEIRPISEVTSLFADDEEKVLAIDPDFSDWVIKNEDLDKIRNLKCVCLQTTSFSWIDVKHLEAKGIPVTNLRGFSSEAVAEWAIAMALIVARKLPVIIRDGWNLDYTKHIGLELKGKTAGVIGLGNIGTRIAELCQAIGMNVQYWSKNSKNDNFKNVDLEELMKTSDFIFPALAQNEETNGMITDEMLKSMKKNAIFISIIHHVYNHDLLKQLVNEGKIYGYGYEEEHVEFDKDKGNIWSGSAIGWCTEESMQRNGVQWVESIVNALNGDYVTKIN